MIKWAYLQFPASNHVAKPHDEWVATCADVYAIHTEATPCFLLLVQCCSFEVGCTIWDNRLIMFICINNISFFEVILNGHWMLPRWYLISKLVNILGRKKIIRVGEGMRIAYVAGTDLMHQLHGAVAVKGDDPFECAGWFILKLKHVNQCYS